jgi:predicted RNA-binding protein with PUA-like domain
MKRAAGGSGVRHWLLKSEPDAFAFDDLWRAKGRTTSWGGVRNYQARNLLRDEIARGDAVLFYHSSADPSGVAGLARVVRAGYPDPTQFDPRDPAHDPKSTPSAPLWFAIDVQAVRKLPRFLALEELRAEPRLAGMVLLKRGSRLSVQPVSASEWRAVLALAGLPPGSDPPEAP